MPQLFTALEHTALERFARVANEKFDLLDADGLLTMHDEFRTLVFESDVVDACVLQELASIRKDCQYGSPFWSAWAITLAQTSKWTLLLSLYTHASESLYFSPFHMLIAVIGTEPLVARRYLTPPKFLEEFGNASVQVNEAITEIFPAGSIATVHGRECIFDVDVSKPVATVKFMSAPFGALQVAFSRDGKYEQAIAADPIDSELVTMCAALREMGEVSSSPVLNKLARHSSFFVRWAAIQAMAKVEPVLALSMLRDATNDDHPSIRVAARKMLSQFDVQG